MLIHKNGDLLKSDCTVIMHQANCMKVMGAGIARSIAQLYPEAQLADKMLPFESKERLGRYSYAKTDGPTVVNLYGQYTFGSGVMTNYEALERSIDSFFTYARYNDEIKLNKVGVPYKIGCGLAGGDWRIVEEILRRQSEKHAIDIYIYKL